MPHRTRSFCLALALATQLPACCFMGGGGGSGGASSPSATSASAPGQAERRRLEALLHDGVAHGEGAGADALAQQVHAGLEPRDAVVVRTSAPGEPRRVVVLVKFDDDASEGLADLDDTRRTEYLDDILAVVDAEGAATEVGIGIRGTWAYGAVLVRRAGSPAHYDTSALASTAELDALLGDMH